MSAPSAPPVMGTPDPQSSPLHPPSVVHNTRILSSLGTLSSCFSGLIAGIIGLTNTSGFLLYLLSSLLTALTLGILKCGGDITRFVPQAHTATSTSASRRKNSARPGTGTAKQATKTGRGSGIWWAWWALTGIGQESFLGFLLFWIGSYALIHVYD